MLFIEKLKALAVDLPANAFSNFILIFLALPSQLQTFRFLDLLVDVLLIAR